MQLKNLFWLVSGVLAQNNTTAPNATAAPATNASGNTTTTTTTTAGNTTTVAPNTTTAAPNTTTAAPNSTAAPETDAPADTTAAPLTTVAGATKVPPVAGGVQVQGAFTATMETDCDADGAALGELLKAPMELALAEASGCDPLWVTIDTVTVGDCAARARRVRALATGERAVENAYTINIPADAAEAMNITDGAASDVADLVKAAVTAISADDMKAAVTKYVQAAYAADPAAFATVGVTSAPNITAVTPPTAETVTVAAAATSGAFVVAVAAPLLAALALF